MDSNVRFRAFFSLRISSIFLIPRSRSAEGSDAEFGTEPSPSSGKSRADSRCTRSKRVAFLCTSPGPGNVSPISSPCWMSHCDEGRHLYNIDRHRSLASLYGGHDPGVCALQTGALSEWLLGYPDKALASINGAVDLAERLGHPFSLAFALLYQAVLYLFRREPDVALRHAHEAEAFAVEQRLALLLDPNILRGKAFLAQGAVENAVASVREGVAARQKTGWDLHPPYHLGIASEVLGGAGDYENAATALAEAEMAINASNERWWEAEIHRLKGVLLLSQGNATQSESCFKRSIRIARQQQASSLELRAATSLARLWGDQGRRVKARDLLAPVYGWFTEGFDSPDLKDARALLDALNA